ncbi:Hypothetical protein PHPALM_36422 [Phytophthora palmivora]|uniref:Uncharacterized protein n=1 Tax=Phytophthora palmivora TaxID=4796 RepID=A0A2P4WZZ1_9STRA|nr:Hypothetical protein PHPALM_36422 [Phytophthora palmivora]
MLLYDQGSHLRNEVVKHLAVRLKLELEFTPVCLPRLKLFTALPVSSALDAITLPHMLTPTLASSTCLMSVILLIESGLQFTTWIKKSPM